MSELFSQDTRTPPGTRLGIALATGLALAAAAVGILLVHRARPGAREVDPASLPEGHLVHVGAEELWGAYVGNAIAAEARYGGRWLRVTGQVGNVTPDTLGFQTALPWWREWQVEGVPPNVVCEISTAHRGGFAAARPGKPFTVLGRFRGLHSDPSVYKGKVVVLEDCRPVDSLPEKKKKN